MPEDGKSQEGNSQDPGMLTDVRDQVSETSVTDVRDREPVDQTSVIDVRDQVERVVIELTDESFGRVDGHVDHGWLDDTVIDAAHVILTLRVLSQSLTISYKLSIPIHSLVDSTG